MRAAGFVAAKGDGYEADDFLAAAAQTWPGEVRVVTSDRDAYQLVSDRVTILQPTKGVTDLNRIDPAGVRERYGVEPGAGRRPDRAARRPVGQAAGRARHRPEEGGRPAAAVRHARRGARRRTLCLGGGGFAALPANRNDGRLCSSSSPLSPNPHLGGGVLLPPAARSRLGCQPASLPRVNEWLSQRADALAAETGVPRERLELSPADIERLLDLAGFAAHESGARTNAPLLCYLVGRRARRGEEPRGARRDRPIDVLTHPALARLHPTGQHPERRERLAALLEHFPRLREGPRRRPRTSSRSATRREHVARVRAIADPTWLDYDTPRVGDDLRGCRARGRHRDRGGAARRLRARAAAGPPRAAGARDGLLHLQQRRGRRARGAAAARARARRDRRLRRPPRQRHARRCSQTTTACSSSRSTSGRSIPARGGPDDQRETTLNVPLPAGSGDAEYVRAFERDRSSPPSRGSSRSSCSSRRASTRTRTTRSPTCA